MFVSAEEINGGSHVIFSNRRRAGSLNARRTGKSAPVAFSSAFKFYSTHDVICSVWLSSSSRFSVQTLDSPIHWINHYPAGNYLSDKLIALSSGKPVPGSRSVWTSEKRQDDPLSNSPSLSSPLAGFFHIFSICSPRHLGLWNRLPSG